MTDQTGETLLALAITRRLLEEFVRRPPPGQRPAELGELTDRESDVLGQSRQTWADQPVWHGRDSASADRGSRCPGDIDGAVGKHISSWVLTCPRGD
jgi:hypothetical protein